MRYTVLAVALALTGLLAGEASACNRVVAVQQVAVASYVPSYPVATPSVALVPAATSYCPNVSYGAVQNLAVTHVFVPQATVYGHSHGGFVGGGRFVGNGGFGNNLSAGDAVRGVGNAAANLLNNPFVQGGLLGFALRGL